MKTIFYFGISLVSLLCSLCLAEETVNVAGKTLVLNGQGTYVYKLVLVNVDVCLGKLFLEKKSSDPDAIIKSKAPKYYRVLFQVDVGGKRMKDGMLESFKKNCGGKECQSTEPLLTQLASCFENAEVGKGTAVEYTLVGDKTSLSIGNKEVCTIKGENLQTYLLNVWIGSHSDQKQYRDRLLGL